MRIVRTFSGREVIKIVAPETVQELRKPQVKRDFCEVLLFLTQPHEFYSSFLLRTFCGVIPKNVLNCLLK